MPDLAPSLLSADFTNLRSELVRLEKAKIRYLHLDVMDGHFVPNITFGPGLIRALRQHTEMIFDAHLMVQSPDAFVDTFIDAGVNMLSVHVEAVTHLDRLLMHVKDRGVKAGVVLNPSTSPESIRYVLDRVDYILIMSVNPGFGGQSFIPSSLQKVREIRKMADQINPSIQIEVDGGIKTHNVREVIEAGADLIVSGSDVFGEALEEKVKSYYQIFNEIV